MPISAQYLKRISLYLLSWGIIIWVLIGNLQSILPRLKYELSFIAANPDFLHSQKLQKRYGQGYDLVELIRQTTPETSTILFPVGSEDPVRSEREWRTVGNPAWLRSFLYPRKLIAVSSTDWDTDSRWKQDKDVFILVLSSGQASWPAKCPPEQDIVYTSSGWGYARVSPVR